MSAENTTEKMKSEENGSNDEENNGDSSNSQATTETGQNEDIRWLKNAQTSALSKVTKKRNELDNCMADVNHLHKVKAAYTELIELCDTYQQAHTEYLTVLTEETDVDCEMTCFEGKQTSNLDFRRQVQSWIQQSEQLLMEKLESASGVGKSETCTRSSHGSSRSGRSSTRSAQLREKVKIVEMLTAQEMLAKQQNMA